ncbi:MAG: hypothetical protein ABSF38_14000 [Verrucomicrobiota bacterium]|jgi:hypothetical protein
MGMAGLGLLGVYFLHLSWRKWPDPIVDAGTQWYAFWRVSQGAAPYHDFLWNYGPLSVALNGLLFNCFGPGMMVLVTANLIVYGLIVSLAYAAFRMAWGGPAAFAASAVFLSVFSFSIFNGVGNYNFATPYSHEATHGLLLMLVTVFVVARWSCRASRPAAFFLGLCGGLAAVLKPEFMLAAAVLGIAGLLCRHWQGRGVGLEEFALILAGVALPTIGFTAWFARAESWPAAFMDASQAWWLVIVKHRTPEMMLTQPAFMGWDNPWANIRLEAQAALCALVLLGAIWAAGWFVNRPWPWPWRLAAALAAGALACSARLDGGWFHVGRCFPGLMLLGFGIVAAGLRREWRQTGLLPERSCMALLLVLLAGAMLARMFLRSRVDHFGFFQAALAGMVAAALIVSKIPSWTGPGAWGRRVALFSSMAMLGLACASLAAQSARHRADQTQPVASGADLFYADAPDIDETGRLVDWSVRRLRSIPPGANLLVLPEGLMINYLSRHKSPPMPDLQLNPESEEQYLAQLGRARPDYVIWLTRDMREAGITKYGAPGNPGEKILRWLEENYVEEGSEHGHSKNATLLRRNPAG